MGELRAWWTITDGPDSEILLAHNEGEGLRGHKSKPVPASLLRIVLAAQLRRSDDRGTEGFDRLGEAFRQCMAGLPSGGG